jgi:pyruvate dehydrogenase E2 component (dihydrolipoamide acetyltransferase)/2-oxoisovalerate dehydrogenase E2 component (dihydrolipoyl transacylase)
LECGGFIAAFVPLVASCTESGDKSPHSKEETLSMDFPVPELGEGVYEAELVRWLVKPGDTVRRGQTLMEVMTDKATMEVPSPFAGVIAKLQAEPGKQVKVGDVVLTYSSEQAASDSGKERTAKPNRKREKSTPATVERRQETLALRPNGPGVPVKAAPSVRFMARKLGIDINHVRGSGPQGRILVEDLGRYVGPAKQPVDAGPARPDYGTPGTRIKLQGLRRLIAARMVQSKSTIPHYTYVDECDVTEMVRLRDGLRDAAAKVGARVTYLAFFVKAVTVALKEVPLVNATLDEAAGEIVLHDRYDIGLAVASPTGLIVPVVRQADKLDLFQIAREIERLSNDARAGKSRLEDLRGSTFTLTSIGGIGGMFATPIINPPEVGILGIGKVVKRPIFDAAGQVKPADMVYLSLSFDHRVVDGAIGAVFGNAIIKQLRQPVGLLVPEK